MVLAAFDIRCYVGIPRSHDEHQSDEWLIKIPVTS
jgi:hypothetical protein